MYLDGNVDHHEMMIEYLRREASSSNHGDDLMLLGNRELFQKVVEVAAKIIAEQEVAEGTEVERRRNPPLARAVRWVATLFSK